MANASTTRAPRGAAGTTSPTPSGAASSGPQGTSAPEGAGGEAAPVQPQPGTASADAEVAPAAASPAAPDEPPPARPEQAAVASEPAPLAEVVMGIEVPEVPPPPPPAAQLQVTGEHFEDEPRSRPSPPMETWPVPLHGALLRCENFTEMGEGVAVQGEVVDTDPTTSPPTVLIWIPAFGRRWPVAASRIKGERWLHHPSDYPIAGEHRGFDMRFRQKVASVHDVPLPVKLPPPAFVPPRHPRGGYAWAQILDDGVAVIGFNEAGESKKDGWKKFQVGELSLHALNGDPKLFKRL